MLTSILDNTDKMLSYLKECEQLKIKILPPDINHSRTGFTVEDGCIRFGFLGVKNLGKGVMEHLVRGGTRTDRFVIWMTCASGCTVATSIAAPSKV